MTKLYYEAHVTIEPVFDQALEEVTTISNSYGFKVAELLLLRREQDTPERSKYDTFTTSRSKDYTDLLNRTLELVNNLQVKGYKVWRYKIEDTLLDVRLK